MTQYGELPRSPIKTTAWTALASLRFGSVIPVAVRAATDVLMYSRCVTGHIHTISHSNSPGVHGGEAFPRTTGYSQHYPQPLGHRLRSGNDFRVFSGFIKVFSPG